MAAIDVPLPPTQPRLLVIIILNRVLRVINERLQGRYNLAVPRPAGLGAADAGNDLPLSVQGQVRREPA